MPGARLRATPQSDPLPTPRSRASGAISPARALPTDVRPTSEGVSTSEQSGRLGSQTRRRGSSSLASVSRAGAKAPACRARRKRGTYYHGLRERWPGSLVCGAERATTPLHVSLPPRAAGTPTHSPVRQAGKGERLIKRVKSPYDLERRALLGQALRRPAAQRAVAAGAQQVGRLLREDERSTCSREAQRRDHDETPARLAISRQRDALAADGESASSSRASRASCSRMSTSPARATSRPSRDRH